MIVELEPVELAEIARLVDAEDHGLQKAVETAKDLGWGDFRTVPGSDGMLGRLKQGIFADARAPPRTRA